MKYIKKYENIKYKIGDYVYLNELNWYIITLTINCGKIVNANYPFYDFAVVANNDIYVLMGTEKSIVRESTPEEIKEYELLKNAIKFNI